MRSITLTILLLLVAIVSIGLAGLRLADGNLARVFGAPVTKTGQPLYEFDAEEVREIQLSGNGVGAVCRLTKLGWWLEQPWNDRMDPRAVEALLDFTLEGRVEGAIPKEKVESVNLGFADGQIAMRFATKDDESLAKYIIGHKTAWFGVDAESGENIPTVYVQPRDKSRKDYLYAYTDRDNIHSYLGDGFKKLRDHHPFMFHSTWVEDIRIRNKQGEMLLSRSNPIEAWKIVKPLGLYADNKALKELIKGLVDLKAINVMNSTEVTLPSEEEGVTDQIAIRFFNQPQELILDIYPPASPEATTVLATMNNRPTAVFELPLNAVAETETTQAMIGLRDMPLTVNQLRDPTLAAINEEQLKSIIISPASGNDILIGRRQPNLGFKFVFNGRMSPVNEIAYTSLIKAVNFGKATEFVSDTAIDLSLYGLEQPFLILRFISFSGDVIELKFGETEDGSIHAIRTGTTSVVKIDPTTMGLISTHPWQWRDPSVWKISVYLISSVVREMAGQQALTLTQTNPVLEEWIAQQGSEDVTNQLSKERTQVLMGNLLTLDARYWLNPTDSEALAALANPTMTFTLTVKTLDDEGEPDGVETIKLDIAKVPRGENVLCYGRVTGEPYPFLLDPKKVELLEVELLNVED